MYGSLNKTMAIIKLKIEKGALMHSYLFFIPSNVVLTYLQKVN
jgi:hypothetical protein